MIAAASERTVQRLARLLASHASIEVQRTAPTAGELLGQPGGDRFEVLLTEGDPTGVAGLRVVETTVRDGRRLWLVEVPVAAGQSFRALAIPIATFHERPFSRDEFLALARSADQA